MVFKIKSMNRIFFSTVFILLLGFGGISGFTPAGAQDLESFKKSLETPDSTVRSRVVVIEHGDAAVAVRAMQTTQPTNGMISGYRIRIYYDNVQNARALAANAVSRFRELFPGIPDNTEYKSPYFTVMVGYFRTREEAVKLQEKIKASLGGTPYVMRANIPMSAFRE